MDVDGAWHDCRRDNSVCYFDSQQPQSSQSHRNGSQLNSMGYNSQTIVLLTFYSAAIVLFSLLGGWLPRFLRLTHTRIQVLISFVGGLMVGVAVFHLLPHALHELDSARVDEVF